MRIISFVKLKVIVHPFADLQPQLGSNAKTEECHD